ncbi:50S ribosomal protein L11 methyltransferase [Nitrosomonas ureae]|uniref:Ribosomal protein L11 methyltransferase n=1 Tax=Nitrosomonas ureae TaxID=44577 RepID=A0A1H9H876_9PROT|nr:50S ribosomal protein L11 methyltransferase [Nitrosomonas ureae]SEQ58473.1 ribosomal protein L11 methyltransferase [Nitrosomonas ureae]
MSWVTLIIKADATNAELLSDALMEQGALSVDIHDAAADTQDEQMLFGEPGEPCDEIWRNAEVSALFNQDVDMNEILHNVMNSVQPGGQLDFRLERIEEQDWVRLTQSQFDPIRISQRLWIVPTWHQAPDPDAINLILNPGLAFGTGSHPTTQLCLSWLDQNLQPGDKVVDYGCGSGILAVAALKLGASHVAGIDIDPQAVKASQENAIRNHCSASQFFFTTDHRAVTRDMQPQGQADIVVANILANPLIMLAPVLAQLVRQQGFIALSGILQQQAAEVKRTYQQWFDMHSGEEQQGWVLLTGSKR